MPKTSERCARTRCNHPDKKFQSSILFGLVHLRGIYIKTFIKIDHKCQNLKIAVLGPYQTSPVYCMTFKNYHKKLTLL